MMDSQDKTLLEGAKLDQPTVEPATEELAADAPVEEQVTETPTANQEESVPEPSAKEYSSKQEILERVREIAHSEEAPAKDEIDHLKSVFYKLITAERDSQMSDYLKDGGDPEKYRILPDDVEEAFKAEMQIIKEKRAKLFLQQEEEKQANYKRKTEIIEEIKVMSSSPQEANQAYQRFKALQQEWKEIGSVPPERATELWRNYQHYVEQYYDQLKLNSEAREYDFKKNLDIKTRICEAAEKLADEPDVVSAFYQLQELHQQYREAGPVAKDLREDIWNRFKAASSVINKRHQQHFEEIRARENENLRMKTELCERAEAIAAKENKTPADWERRTKEILDLQKEWKQIGFAPQKMNVKIFERFRSINDNFFKNKAAFFRGFKEVLTANAEKKKAMVARAKELSESTDWEATAQELVKLQQEWKEVGPIVKKLGEPLWNEFKEACNKFFEARKAAGNNTYVQERQNLAKKKAIIKQLKALEENPTEDMLEQVQQLQKEYTSIGHVPYKEKDHVYKEFHTVINKLYDALNISINKRNLDNFVQNLKSVADKGGSAMNEERGKLMRKHDQLKQEITTYENNLGFFNTTSKNGNTLLEEMNRKVQKLKDELELVRQKIKAIDKANTSQQ